LVSSFQDSPVIDTGSINVAAVTWEAPRKDEESFRDYAARRAASFGYPSLRDGQVDALEKHIEYKRDVMLIAKTSFGKGLIFKDQMTLVDWCTSFDVKTYTS
jgi:hypothetical protein